MNELRHWARARDVLIDWEDATALYLVIAPDAGLVAHVVASMQIAEALQSLRIATADVVEEHSREPGTVRRWARNGTSD